MTVRVEQMGSAACSVPANGDFVLVDIPLRAEGDAPLGEAEYHYTIGPFVGRVVPWPLDDEREFVARLRIPYEKFVEGQDLVLEVRDRDSSSRLFRATWEAGWQGEAPVVAPAGRGPDPFRGVNTAKTRYYRSGD
jgi:hypothetical protein